MIDDISFFSELHELEGISRDIFGDFIFNFPIYNLTCTF